MAPHAFDNVYGAENHAAIAAVAEPVHVPVASPALAQSCPWLSEVEVLFTGWGAPRLDAVLLARLPRLQLVLHGAGSVRSIVTDEFWARGVRIASVTALNAIPVAEYTLAAILLGLKSAWQLAADAREQHRFPGITRRMAVPGVYGSTVGLVSYGMIARLVRERLRPFELKVIAYDPFVPARELAQADVLPAGLEELFATADVISVHAPSLPSTRGMITGELVARMKPGTTLINTSRGSVLREDELVEVLARRPDLQAVLDVTDPEPPSQSSPLYTLPNVFLTPHIAGSLGSECRRLGRGVVAELERYVAGQPLQFELSRQQAEQQT